MDWGKTTEASSLRIAGQSAPSSQHCLIHFYWELRFGEASVLERLVRVRKSRLISLLQNPHPCDSLFPLLPLLLLLRQYLLSGRHFFPLDKYHTLFFFSFLFLFLPFLSFFLSLSLWKFGLRVFYLPFFPSFPRLQPLLGSLPSPKNREGVVTRPRECENGYHTNVVLPPCWLGDRLQ